MKIKPILMLFIALSFLSCNSNKECDTCTNDLRQASITIVDQNQQPVILDSYIVIDLVTNEEITIQLSPEELMYAQQNGMYPLVNDFSFSSSLSLQIEFQGFQNGILVVNEEFTVTADCCQKIQTVEGNQEVIIN